MPMSNEEMLRMTRSFVVIRTACRERTSGGAETVTVHELVQLNPAEKARSLRNVTEREEKGT
jgi:hypothetical protein